MDINVAQTFLEVVKTGSFVGAASNLNLTQTAVSARIRTLEEQLERPVFVRNKAGAKLTPAGERFFKFATSLVQVWGRARQSVALPSGKDTIAVVGVELSLWSPLLRHWLLWMRREHPEIAVSTVIDSSDRLMAQVQDGSLDVAVLYGAPRRPGVIAELLFEEKLVLVRTTPASSPIRTGDYVQIDWGGEFLADYHAAFPDSETSSVNISHGPLALDYILAVGGCGYFREGFIRPYLDEGRLVVVPDSPEFSYSAYVVHSAKADQGVIGRIRNGFRHAAMVSG
ncbi:LysR family transcriptional regulator [Thalassospira xiamenensis]|uniref:DNA-binding transcriptional regulator, LysR family n=1 Tax=Thalassospira xiamenensis TaxID=220697 RepID=A0A154KX99_9PROT|nr:LysR family transcriptional regulator [Thalassospira xiamenensis]KZB56333.1 LysR family transcriptional regulator [Thalassospira xiamenensis]MCK2167225.1 LysR family transcriptional regulator [Thalassospira xiamenensis]RCK49975.1 LysR family transcriptional regulator [Thalassospira xiamenensis]SOC30197.1 DNA-binding transcriptional regulator, LysR family [Thalassospira xiamenensis]